LACQSWLPGLLLASDDAPNYAARVLRRQEAGAPKPMWAFKDFRDDGQETHPHRR
jgi:hypothetical protein